MLVEIEKEIKKGGLATKNVEAHKGGCEETAAIKPQAIKAQAIKAQAIKAQSHAPQLPALLDESWLGESLWFNHGARA